MEGQESPTSACPRGISFNWQGHSGHPAWDYPLVKKFVVLLIVVAILLIAVIVYRSRSTRQLNVDPDAAREIEKAKQR